MTTGKCYRSSLLFRLLSSFHMWFVSWMAVLAVSAGFRRLSGRRLKRKRRTVNVFVARSNRLDFLCWPGLWSQSKYPQHVWFGGSSWLPLNFYSAGLAWTVHPWQQKPLFLCFGLSASVPRNWSRSVDVTPQPWCQLKLFCDNKRL